MQSSAEPLSDDATLQFYSETAERYAELSKGHLSADLSAFLARLAPNDRILELGCGAGYEAQAMIKAGFTVDPTDGSAEMAERAHRLLNLPVSVLRFDQIEAREKYDAVWANGALTHVPRRSMKAVLETIQRALKRGGLHYATYKTGEAEGRDASGRYFNYFSVQEIRDVYESSQWEMLCINEFVGNSYHAASSTNWAAIWARKPL
jgi:cyclopropane fatty-acyl-phospholipid synthase-like methyltransferase